MPFATSAGKFTLCSAKLDNSVLPSSLTILSSKSKNTSSYQTLISFAQHNNATSDCIFRNLEWAESGSKEKNDSSMTKEDRVDTKNEQMRSIIRKR